MRYLLDTDHVIDYLYGNQQTRDLLATLQPEGLAISAISYSEIYEGIYASKDPKKAEQAFRAFLTGATVLPLNRTVARRNAQIRRQLREARRPITHRPSTSRSPLPPLSTVWPCSPTTRRTTRTSLT